MSDDKYTADYIFYEDAGIGTLANDYLRYLMSDALALVPANVADEILESCRIHMFEADNDGEYIPAEVLGGKDLIVLSREALAEPKEYQIRLLLHECAHRILGHDWWQKSETDHNRQEAEAWAKVDEWIGPAVEMAEGERVAREQIAQELESTREGGKQE